MPQMGPMKWLNLYFMFILFFIFMFLIVWYFMGVLQLKSGVIYLNGDFDNLW